MPWARKKCSETAVYLLKRQVKIDEQTQILGKTIALYILEEGISHDSHLSLGRLSTPCNTLQDVQQILWI